MGGQKRSEKKLTRLQRLVRLVSISLLAMAVVRELRRPAQEREWHGSVAGVVPYELRVPTLQRARERWWSPDDPRLLQPTVFGVGWTLNVGRLLRLLRRR